MKILECVFVKRMNNKNSEIYIDRSIYFLKYSFTYQGDHCRMKSFKKHQYTFVDIHFGYKQSF